MRDNPFRNTKIHGYHKVKLKSQRKFLQDVTFAGYILIMLRVLVVAIMLLVAKYQDNFRGSMQFLYHLTDNLAWFVVGMYIFIYHKNIIGYPYKMHLKRISLLALVVVSINIFITIAFGIIETSRFLWLAIYYIFTVLTWSVLAIFFYSYWKHCKHRSEKVEG